MEPSCKQKQLLQTKCYEKCSKFLSTHLQQKRKGKKRSHQLMWEAKHLSQFKVIPTKVNEQTWKQKNEYHQTRHTDTKTKVTSCVLYTLLHPCWQNWCCMEQIYIFFFMHSWWVEIFYATCLREFHELLFKIFFFFPDIARSLDCTNHLLGRYHTNVYFHPEMVSLATDCKNKPLLHY